MEYKVMKIFKDIGCEVFRTAGSHTKVDVIVLQDPVCGIPIKPKLIQCKSSKGLMSKKEQKEFAEYCLRIGCSAVFAYREKRQIRVDSLT